MHMQPWQPRVFYTDFSTTVSCGAGGGGDDPEKWLKKISHLFDDSLKKMMLPSPDLIPGILCMRNLKTLPPLPVCCPDEYSEQPDSGLMSLPVEVIERIIGYTKVQLLDTRQLVTNDGIVSESYFNPLARTEYAVALTCKTFCKLTRASRTALLVGGVHDLPLNPQYLMSVEEMAFKQRFHKENTSHKFGLLFLKSFEIKPDLTFALPNLEVVQRKTSIKEKFAQAVQAVTGCVKALFNKVYK